MPAYWLWYDSNIFYSSLFLSRHVTVLPTVYGKTHTHSNTHNARQDSKTRRPNETYRIPSTPKENDRLRTTAPKREERQKQIWIRSPTWISIGTSHSRTFSNRSIYTMMNIRESWNVRASDPLKLENEIGWRLHPLQTQIGNSVKFKCVSTQLKERHMYCLWSE